MELKKFNWNPLAKFFEKNKADTELEKKEIIQQNAQGRSQEELESSQYDSIANVGRDNTVVFSIDFEQCFKQKATRVAKYREMSNFPEINEALDYVCDESVVADEEGNIAKLKIKNEDIPKNIQKKIQGIYDYLYNEVYEFNDNAWDYFRKWIVESEIFIENILDKDKKNIIGVKILPSYSTYPIYKGTQIAGFNQIQTPQANYSLMGTRDDVTFESNQITYLNYGLYGQNLLDVRGYLEAAIRTYNQLRNLEDALIVARLVRAPERKIWNINTGRMPKGKAEEYIQQLIHKYKKKLTYDTETGKVDSAQNVQALTEDYWFAMDAEGKGTQVSVLQSGMQLGELNDVNYILKKLYRVLKIPKGRWQDGSPGMFGLGRPGEVSQDEIKFANFINRLQNRFKGILLDPFMTLLKMRGIDEQYLNKAFYDVEFNESNFFKLFKETGILQERLNILGMTANYIATPDTAGTPYGLLSKEYVLKKFFMMSDAEYDKNKELLEAELVKAKEDQMRQMEQQQNDQLNNSPYQPVGQEQNQQQADPNQKYQVVGQTPPNQNPFQKAKPTNEDMEKSLEVPSNSTNFPMNDIKVDPDLKKKKDKRKLLIDNEPSYVKFVKKYK